MGIEFIPIDEKEAFIFKKVKGKPLFNLNSFILSIDSSLITITSTSANSVDFIDFNSSNSSMQLGHHEALKQINSFFPLYNSKLIGWLFKSTKFKVLNFI